MWLQQTFESAILLEQKLGSRQVNIPTVGRPVTGHGYGIAGVAGTPSHAIAGEYQPTI